MLPIKHISLAPFDNSFGNQRRAGSKDDRISKDATYFARIHGRWYFGSFSEQWYGWSFDDWGVSGIQLDLIEDLYEVDISPLAKLADA